MTAPKKSTQLAQNSFPQLLELEVLQHADAISTYLQEGELKSTAFCKYSQSKDAHSTLSDLYALASQEGIDGQVVDYVVQHIDDNFEQQMLGAVHEQKGSITRALATIYNICLDQNVLPYAGLQSVTPVDDQTTITLRYKSTIPYRRSLSQLLQKKTKYPISTISLSPGLRPGKADFVARLHTGAYDTLLNVLENVRRSCVGYYGTYSIKKEA